MTFAAQRALVTKEVRAIWPLWAAGMAAAVVMAAAGEPRSVPWILGGMTLAMSAHGVGHEFAGRTMDILLAQPVTRRRVWGIKLGVLAAAVAAALVGVVIAATVADRPMATMGDATLFSVAALFVGAALALTSRSALAGLVFTGAFFVLLVVVARFSSAWLWPEGSLWDLRAVQWQVVRTLTMVTAVLAAAGGLVWFQRVDIREAAGGDLLGGRLASTVRAPRRRGGGIALVAKELRLQSLTFVVAGIGLLSLLAAGAAERASPDLAAGVFVLPIIVLGIGAVAVVSGATASAGERQLGVLPSQILLPLSTRRQWAIKVVVLASVVSATAAVLIAVGVIQNPGLEFWGLYGRLRIRAYRIRELGDLLPWTALVVGALWVSTLSTDVVRAIAAAVVAMPAGAWLLAWTDALGSRIALGLTPRLEPVDALSRWEWLHRGDGAWLHALTASIPVAGVVTILGLALVFAFRNHRSLERRPWTIVTQIATVATALVSLSVVVDVMRVQVLL